MYCENCGKKNIPEAKFCAYCGFKLTLSEKDLKQDLKYDNYPLTETNQEEIRILKNPSFNKIKILKKYSFFYFFTRLFISTIDFFFAGIAAFLLILVINPFINSYLTNSFFNNKALEKFIILTFLTSAWEGYILLNYFLFKGQTLGAKLAKVKIISKYKLLSNLLGPLLIFDYLFKNKLLIKSLKVRKIMYFLCFLFLTTWEYLFFLLIIIYLIFG